MLKIKLVFIRIIGSLMVISFAFTKQIRDVLVGEVRLVPMSSFVLIVIQPKDRQH